MSENGIPNFVTIKERGSMLAFVFNDIKDATLFLKQNSLPERVLQQCRTEYHVSLNQNEVDELFHIGAFKQFSVIDNALSLYEFPKLLSSIIDSPSFFLNHVLLLADNKRITVLKRLASLNYPALLARIFSCIDLDFLKQAALLQDNNGSCLFRAVAYYQSEVLFEALLKRADDALCDKVALLKDNSGFTVISRFIENQNSHILSAFIKRISSETISKAVLSDIRIIIALREKHPFLIKMILPLLNHAACEFISDKKLNNLTNFEWIFKHEEQELFLDFCSQLSTKRCTSLLLDLLNKLSSMSPDLINRFDLNLIDYFLITLALIDNTGLSEEGYQVKAHLLCKIPQADFKGDYQRILKKFVLHQDHEGCNGLVREPKLSTLLDYLSISSRKKALLMRAKNGQLALSEMIRVKALYSIDVALIKNLVRRSDRLSILLDLTNLSFYCFIIALPYLTERKCEQLALSQYRGGGFLHLAQHASNEYGQGLVIFFKRLNKQTRSQALFQKDKLSGLTAFSFLFQKDLYTSLQKKISDADCNKFALLTDEKGLSVVFQIPDILVLSFLKRLDSSVRIKVVMRLGQERKPDLFFLSGLVSWIVLKESGIPDYIAHHPEQFTADILMRSYNLWFIMSIRALLPVDTVNEILLPRFNTIFNEIKTIPEQDLRFIRMIPTSILIQKMDEVILQRDILNVRQIWRLIYAVNVLATHPRGRETLRNTITKLHSIQFYDGGNSSDNWSTCTKMLFSALPNAKIRRAPYDLSNKLVIQRSSPPLRQLDYLNRLSKAGWQLVRLQGRTLLLENAARDVLAVKIQKKGQGELPESLIREFETTNYLKTHAQQLDILSTLPTPLSVMQIANVYDWLRYQLVSLPYKMLNEFMNMIGDDDTEHTAYIYYYKQQHSYSTYLHAKELSDEEFNAANKVIVHDLFRLLQHGMVFTQLGDIFHNIERGAKDRFDKGRYRVLVNLLNDSNLGGGRLTGWKKAVDFPNLRASGIADLGDFVSINDFLGDNVIAHPYFGDIKARYGAKAGNYLLANIMAEYQYLLFLIAGRRACELTAGMDKKSEAYQVVWLHVAEQLIKNCAQAVALLTHYSQAEAEQLLFAVIGKHGLAEQMHYWMTTEYINDFKVNRVPETLYDQAGVTINFLRVRKETFNDLVGCSINNNESADLGTVNGQDPIKKGDALRYWMVFLIFNAYYQFASTYSSVKKVLEEKDLARSEKLRQGSFNYLPHKQWHRLQELLCEERLQQPISSTMKKQFNEERLFHKQHGAALRIQGFWRQHRQEQARVSCAASSSVSP